MVSLYDKTDRSMWIGLESRQIAAPELIVVQRAISDSAARELTDRSQQPSLVARLCNVSCYSARSSRGRGVHPLGFKPNKSLRSTTIDAHCVSMRSPSL